MEGKILIIFIVLAVIFATGCVDNSSPAEEQNKSSASTVSNESMEKIPDTAVTETPDSSVEEYNPDINPDNFVKTIDNSYFPLKPGTTFTYEGDTEDETERSEVSVTNQTREILGVSTTVVHDRVWEDGKLIEETFDWYAQDKEGNVWYFGEDSKEFEDGEVVSTEGSSEAGIDEAKPGIIMKASPKVGDNYRQEYYPGEAEDMAEVVSLNESVSIAYGIYENCLMTREWNLLEPGIEENKYYAPGVGTVLETAIKGGSGRMELINVTTEQV